MPPLMSKEIYTSEIVKFVVGAGQKEFKIHSALIANHSDAFKAMFGDCFTEGQDGCAQLKDVDEDTFLSFSDFMYKGNYELPGPTMPKFEVEGGQTPTETPTKISKSKIKKLGGVWNQPTNAQWDGFCKGGQFGLNKRSISDSVLNANMEHGYSHVLISQAKVFIFADCYRIHGLEALSMQKLHDILCRFRLDRSRALDIVALVRLCYSGDTPDMLRRLVTDYVSCVMEKLCELDGFQTLLSENGKFSADLNIATAARLRMT